MFTAPLSSHGRLRIRDGRAPYCGCARTRADRRPHRSQTNAGSTIGCAIPHPAACSPQAWASASVVPVQLALLAHHEQQPRVREPAVVGLDEAPAHGLASRSKAHTATRSRAHLHIVPSAPDPIG